MSSIRFYKKIMILALMFTVGLSLAINEARTVNWITESRYNPTAINSDITEGGNVTNMNISGNVSTEKWAGYWGNVSATIILSPNSDGSNIFYSWTWSPTSGGEVCAVAAPSGFNWATVQTATTANIDSIWGFTSTDTDSAANTLGESCAVNVAGTAVSGSVGETTGVGGFQTCAVGDGDNAAKSDFAFCVNITANGNLFNGNSGDYELLVPTDETAGNTETYYFWVELV